MNILSWELVFCIENAQRAIAKLSRAQRSDAMGIARKHDITMRSYATSGFPWLLSQSLA